MTKVAEHASRSLAKNVARLQVAMNESKQMHVLNGCTYLRDVPSNVHGKQILACDETTKRKVTHAHLDANAAVALKAREQLHDVTRILSTTMTEQSGKAVRHAGT